MTGRASIACLLALLPFTVQSRAAAEDADHWARHVLIDPDDTEAVCFQALPERAVRTQSEFNLSEPAARVLNGLKLLPGPDVDRSGPVAGRTQLRINSRLSGYDLKFVRAVSYAAIPDRSLLVMARRTH